ncbi:rhamnosyltransferase WsaF family glycosyltransferase [Nevskia ramosa]|uniref:rhamnosyltransferase WsaF family glycosyltransferase n=1 Tax=Nevskia ramosa TaxID=64002 RepID=UPI0003B76351|nr:hypothetical protein [Nevskia ramosa]
MSRIRSALRHFLPGAVNSAKAIIRRFARYGIGDIGNFPVRYQIGHSRRARINLVVPVLSQKNAFGGVATALRFFERLRGRFPMARIIVTQEYGFEFEPHHWKQWLVNQTDNGRRHALEIVFLNGRDKPFDIDDRDFFVGTHWTTAFQIKKWQFECAAQLGITKKPFLYFIQDFEPGFYAWSSEYLLADSTYRPADDILAVFNTRLLHDYFRLRSYHFLDEHHFQPKLNPKLAAVLGDRKEVEKKKLILVYGRPTTARNAFTLLLAGLRHWAMTDPQAAQWTVLSLGETHPPFDLSPSVRLTSAGKLSLDQYAQTLLDAAVGCSLMVSPHPSYPPLEMAAFGATVITNNFENKDLSIYSRNIVSLAEVSPESLSVALSFCCKQMAETMHATIPQLKGLLSAQDQDEFPFVDALANRWLAVSPSSEAVNQHAH